METSELPCGPTYHGRVKLRSAAVYTVLRLLAFLVPFAILVALFPFFRAQYWLAGIFAALIGLSLSLLFLRRPLDEVTSSLAARRAADRAAASDADAEDAAADAVIGRTPEGDAEDAAAAGEASVPRDIPASAPADRPTAEAGSDQPTNAQNRNAP